MKEKIIEILGIDYNALSEEEKKYFDEIILEYNKKAEKLQEYIYYHENNEESAINSIEEINSLLGD